MPGSCNWTSNSFERSLKVRGYFIKLSITCEIVSDIVSKVVDDLGAGPDNPTHCHESASKRQKIQPESWGLNPFPDPL